MKLLCVLFALVVVSRVQCATSVLGTVRFDSFSKRYSFERDVYDVTGSAYGTYRESVEETGWGTLMICGGADDPSIVSYAAGYLEGALMTERIYQMVQNILVYNFGEEKIVPKAISDFMTSQRNWMIGEIFRHAGQSDQYWEQISYLDAQFVGLLNGYNDHCERGKSITWMELYLLNSAGDLEDLIPALVPSLKTPHMELRENEDPLLYTDCSGLIRVALLNDNTTMEDVFVGHTTWRSYSAMLRTFKFYNFAMDPDSPLRNISFSSSPGFISSKDDMYTISGGLVTLETTNAIFDKDLYKLVNPSTVLIWQRTMTANRLATNGEEWSDYLSMYNSGTYNNQWMVVDFNLFEKVPLAQLKDGFLWIAEQIPGTVQSGDVTSVLRSQGYWPSYNIPYFVEIYNASGYPWPSTYETCPRANIFRRDAPGIDSFPQFQDMMQYNDWKEDPFSLNASNNAVSSRYDLRWENPVPFGGIDSKVTSTLFAPLGVTFGVSGPTKDQQPVFEWTGKWANSTIHEGQPTSFNFPWVQFDPDTV